MDRAQWIVYTRAQTKTKTAMVQTFVTVFIFPAFVGAGEFALSVPKGFLPVTVVGRGELVLLLEIVGFGEFGSLVGIVGSTEFAVSLGFVGFGEFAGSLGVGRVGGFGGGVLGPGTFVGFMFTVL